MDLNDYWQENKRFVTMVAGGAIVFLIAFMMISDSYGKDINTSKTAKGRLEKNLKGAVYSARDLRTVQEENEALEGVVANLSEAATFPSRDGFRLVADGGSAPNQYLRIVSRVREDLVVLANRANLALDGSLGMPQLSPTREDEIERYLEALDVVDRVSRAAIQARVKRLEKIKVRIDPGLGSRNGVGRIERTRVSFTIIGSGASLTAILAATQRPRDGAPLAVQEVELEPARNKRDEARLDLTLIIPRLVAVEEAD